VSAPGYLIGVGVGPGDPEHLTLKALRVLREADRVFVPQTESGNGTVSRARSVVEPHVDSDRIQQLTFAMSDRAAREGMWDRAGAVIADFVSDGGTAAFATIGDPNLYSTFTYIASTVKAVVPDVQVSTVPGITAMQDLAARSGVVLAEGAEPLTLLPYTSGDDRLEEALAAPGTVVVYKGGRHLPRVLEAVREAGRLDESVYGQDLGLEREQVSAAGARVGSAPYMSTVIVPARRAGRRGENL
jgi:precorrin-2/cobalt-factor-2 C20-methyltransferase